MRRDDTGAINDDLAFAENCANKSRRPRTWHRYRPSWLKAAVYLQGKLAACGLAYTALALRKRPQFLVACLAHEYRTSTAISAVDNMRNAIVWACKLNGITYDTAKFHFGAMNMMAKRERSKAVKQMAGLAPTQVRQINATWGHLPTSIAEAGSLDIANNNIVKVQMAAAMSIGFAALGRYSDVVSVGIGAIFWCSLGVCVCLTFRKNRQDGRPQWVPIRDNGNAIGIVATLRRLVAARGFTVPHEGFIETNEMLVVPFAFRTGHRQRHTRRLKLVPDEHCTHRRHYSAYLKLFREALEVCCKVPTLELSEYGTQSARSGGDTHLWRQGVSAERRRLVGLWKTPSVELGYLRTSLMDDFNLVAHMDL
jgi:hypothetical protein